MNSCQATFTSLLIKGDVNVASRIEEKAAEITVAEEEFPSGTKNHGALCEHIRGQDFIFMENENTMRSADALT